MSHVLKVFITVDTEVWPWSRDWRATALKDDLRRDIHGITPEGEFGIPYQMDLLNAHGLKGVFFVESLAASVVGPEPLREIVSLIQERGQDVQLHLHTEWLRWMADSILPGRNGLNIKDFTLDEQTTLLARGLENLRACGATGVDAFRAGNYGANRDTLHALARNGVVYDSSYNFCDPESHCGIKTDRMMLQPAKLEGMVEFPISFFQDRPGHHRHYQLCACSTGELENVLMQAWKRRWHSVVLVSHSFELIDRRLGTGSPPKADFVLVNRFRRFCRFLEKHRDKFQTSTFAEVDPAKLPAATAGPVEPLKSNLFLTSGRYASQARRRVGRVKNNRIVDPARVRVVHVSLSLNTGGLEKLLVEFAKYADRDRFDLRFVALTQGGYLADQIASHGWPVSVLGLKLGWHPTSMLRLTRMLQGCGGAVIHMHNTAPLFYAAPALRMARIPIGIYTRHYGLELFPSRHERRLFRLATKLVNRVVCVSHDGARLSIEEGAAPEKVRTIWNGIDITKFTYKAPAAGGPVVAVARLCPEKDVSTLLDAVALAARRDPDVRLEIAGDGPSRADLERHASQLKIGAHVRFLGEVRDVSALLARASMFVLPSLTEGISLTLLEAMARGLPVVATAVGGNPEVIVDGETGYLVPSGASGLMAERLLQLRNDPDRARDFGQSGRARIEQHFDIRRMISDYEALYLEELAAHQKSQYARSRSHPGTRHEHNNGRVPVSPDPPVEETLT